MLRFSRSLLVAAFGVVAAGPFASAADDLPDPEPRILITGEAGKAFVEKYGGKLKKHVKQLDLFSLEVPSKGDLEELIAKATAKGFKAEEDQVRSAVGLRANSGRKLMEETPWGISKVYEKDGTPDIPDLDFFPTGDGMNRYMCVIDTGYVEGHPDLPPAGNAGSTTLTDTRACDYHGTHVAGTVQAIGGNDEGVIGVYPGADPTFSVRVFRPWFGLCLFTYASNLIGAAYDCADAGAGVINMSLGGGAPTDAERDGFADLYYNQGVLPVAAAGNGANTAYSYPASYDAVMSVAALDRFDNLASFSQRNDQVEIGGPGVDVKSTVGPVDQYDVYSGTSMASPHVAAVALVLQNKFPGASTQLVRFAMNKGAIDLGAPGRDNSYGNGLVNYWNAAEIVADCDEGVNFQATYQGRDYDLACQWILEQDQFPMATVCSYPDGNAGDVCTCVCG